jgi:hypothetical protein
MQRPVEPSAPDFLKVRTVKVTVVLSPEVVAAIGVRDGVPRVKLSVTWEHGTLRADVAAKAMRKAQRTIAEHGVEGVAVVLQGRLGHNEILEAGLSAQLKARPDSSTEKQETNQCS